jgi:hypothetical protein
MGEGTSDLVGIADFEVNLVVDAGKLWKEGKLGEYQEAVLGSKKISQLEKGKRYDYIVVEDRVPWDGVFVERGRVSKIEENLKAYRSWCGDAVAVYVSESGRGD